MRQWHLEALEIKKKAEKAERAKAFAEKLPFLPSEDRAPIFDAWVTDDAIRLERGDSLASGRTVVAWPFLLQAKTLRRVQEAGLAPEGLVAPRMEIDFDDLAKAIPVTAEDETPHLAEEKRWKDSLLLSVTAFTDPKIMPSHVSCEVLEAFDEKGNDLRLPFPRFQPVNTTVYERGSNVPVSIKLASKQDMGKKLVKLKGVLHFSIVTRSQHWETTDLTTPVADTLKLDGGLFKISFSGLQKTGDKWNASFDASSQGQHLKHFWEERVAFAKHGSSPRGVLDFSGLPAMKLVDDKGTILFAFNGSSSHRLSHHLPDKTLPPVTVPTTNLSPIPPDFDTNYAYGEKQNFDFRISSDPNRPVPALGNGVKLVVDFPLERRQISVPFEFTDLPLPPS